MPISRRVLTLLACATLAGAAFGQDQYPSKPIRLIVPFPPGASTDLLGRALAQKLSTNMGVPVVVDNKGGAAGTMGSDLLARSAPDGYTIGVAVPATHSIPIALSRKLPYDALKDFTPLSIVANNPLAIVVAPSVPANTLRELVEYARKNPGKLMYGTSGAGTSQHLVGEMLNQFAKIDILHVPYKGGSPALNDLLGGQIQVGYVVVATVLGHGKAGKLKMLAISSKGKWMRSGRKDFAETILHATQSKNNWRITIQYKQGNLTTIPYLVFYNNIVITASHFLIGFGT